MPGARRVARGSSGLERPTGLSRSNARDFPRLSTLSGRVPQGLMTMVGGALESTHRVGFDTRRHGVSFDVRLSSLHRKLDVRLATGSWSHLCPSPADGRGEPLRRCLSARSFLDESLAAIHAIDISHTAPSGMFLQRAPSCEDALVHDHAAIWTEAHRHYRASVIVVGAMLSEHSSRSSCVLVNQGRL